MSPFFVQETGRAGFFSFLLVGYGPTLNKVMLGCRMADVTFKSFFKASRIKCIYLQEHLAHPKHP